MEEPGAGVGPPALGCRFGNVQDLRGFPELHANEITKLYKFGFVRVLRRECVERFVDGEKFIILYVAGDFYVCDVQSALTAAVAESLFAAGVVNENAAHGLRRRAEKVRAVLPRLLLVADQAQPRLMHQRGGLQRLARGLVGHFECGEPAEFLIDEREQFFGGFGVALLHRAEDLGHLAHSLINAWEARAWLISWCFNGPAPKELICIDARIGGVNAHIVSAIPFDPGNMSVVE